MSKKQIINTCLEVLKMLIKKIPNKCKCKCCSSECTNEE